MLEQDSRPPMPGPSRDWLAALLLRRQSRLMPRFTAAFVRLRAAPRADMGEAAPVRRHTRPVG